MASRRLFDGAQIELDILPIVGAPPPVAGSQFYIKVAGVWKTATAYIKVAGVWKVADPYIKVTGTWK
jgi:hypothetical protein